MDTEEKRAYKFECTLRDADAAAVPGDNGRCIRKGDAAGHHFIGSRLHKHAQLHVGTHSRRETQTQHRVRVQLRQSGTTATPATSTLVAVGR